MSSSLCGVCAHDVRHNHGVECDRCGCDLRTMGICAPSMRRDGFSRAQRSFAWTVFYFVIAMVLRGILIDIGFTSLADHLVFAIPDADSGTAIDMTFERFETPWSDRLRPAEVTLHGLHGETFSVRLNPRDDSLAYVDADRKPHTAAISSASLLEALSTPRLLSDAETQTLLPAVQNAFDVWRASDFAILYADNVRIGQTREATRYAEQAVPVMFLLVAAAWIWTLVRVWRTKSDAE